MKASLWNQTVAPPSTTTSARLTHSIVSIFLPRASSKAICASVATMTTTVASSTGASLAPTTPPETMKPKCSVANAAAQSLWASAYLKVPKKNRIGRKSSSSFMDSWGSAPRPDPWGGGWRCQIGGLKSIEAELMQKRSPVGAGPSLNTWPRCEPQVLQRTSMRVMPWLRSVMRSTTVLLIGSE